MATYGRHMVEVPREECVRADGCGGRLEASE